MALKAGRVGVNPRDVDAQGHIQTRSYIDPVAKTEAMTQPVGVDSSGKLYTKPGSGGTVTKILDNCPAVLNTDYDLTAGLSDFDFVLIEAVVPYSAANPNLLSSIHIVSMCEAGKKLNVFNEASAGGFVVKSNTVLTGGGHNFQGATPTFYVYGIKL